MNDGSGRESRRKSSLVSARFLSLPVFSLAAFAAVFGLFSSYPAEKKSFVNAWGEVVALDGRGIYRLESVSGAAQERGQDIVTIAFALPLLAFAWYRSRNTYMRERVFLGGILGYFLYAYGLMAFGAVYSELFLVYVAIFAAALFGFVFALLSVDVDALASRCANAFPRKTVIGIDLAVGALLGAMWLWRIISGLVMGLPPPAIDGYHTLFVQAGDLALLVPAAGLSAWWVFKRDNRGYLIGTVLLVKGAAMGLAVAVMGVSMNLSGEGAYAPIPLIVVFFGLAAFCSATALRALKSIGPGAGCG